MSISNEDIATALLAVINAIEKLKYGDNEKQLSKIIGDERRRLHQILNLPPPDERKPRQSSRPQNPWQNQAQHPRQICLLNPCFNANEQYEKARSEQPGNGHMPDGYKGGQQDDDFA